MGTFALLNGVSQKNRRKTLLVDFDPLCKWGTQDEVLMYGFNYSVLKRVLWHSKCHRVWHFHVKKGLTRKDPFCALYYEHRLTQLNHFRTHQINVRITLLLAFVSICIPQDLFLTCIFVIYSSITSEKKTSKAWDRYSSVLEYDISFLKIPEDKFPEILTARKSDYISAKHTYQHLNNI